MFHHIYEEKKALQRALTAKEVIEVCMSIPLTYLTSNSVASVTTPFHQQFCSVSLWDMASRFVSVVSVGTWSCFCSLSRNMEGCFCTLHMLL